MQFWAFQFPPEIWKSGVVVVNSPPPVVTGFPSSTYTFPARSIVIEEIESGAGLPAVISVHIVVGPADAPLFVIQRRWSSVAKKRIFGSTGLAATIWGRMRPK